MAKKSPVPFVLTTLFCLAALFLASAAPLSASLDLNGRVIVIDPGHGTIHFNNRILNTGRITKEGVREHDVVMRISENLGQMLRKEGALVYYTRTWDNYWREAASTVQDNKARAVLANELKADAYLSIHCDWHPSARRKGISTFYEKPNSERLAFVLHKSMIRTLKAKNHNVHNESYTVLDVAEVPAVLVETGFLSNRSDRQKLIKSSYQKDVAKSLFLGLKSYFGNQKKK